MSDDGANWPATIRPGRAAEVFPVRFTVPDCGWIYLHMPALLGGEYSVRCSSVSDPFPAMIAWLEAICTGAPHAIWEIDEEGAVALLIFHADVNVSGNDSARLIHCCAGREVYRTDATAVSPRALVEGFWTAFRAVIADPAYQPDQWEMPEHQPAIVFDMDDPRWTAEVEAQWRAGEQANPYGASILRFLESPVIEAALADPDFGHAVPRRRWVRGVGDLPG